MMGKNTERPSKIFSGFGEAAPVAPNRKKRNGSSAGKRHMARVAQLPCVLCGAHGVQVHHLREGEAAGAGQRAHDQISIPLCVTCHTGPHGVHGDKSLLRLHKVTEIDLLARTIEQLMEQSE